MKRPFPYRRHSLLLTASAALVAAGLASTPVLRAQQPSPTPEPSASPAASGSQPDIFDVIKKGADKLQKEAKEQKELAPEIKRLNERQADLLRRHLELERHLQTILLKQNDSIEHLEHEVEKLDKEVAESKAQSAPKPAAPLPMTEPTPAPTPAASPSPAPTQS
jgi:predicted RNase H-like nuclease (RuvC/YqgF family)